ncbi:centromere-associated protein E-like isoform X2 [Montipora capricornis]|uniref:centromere-associated protein E-like isoform X2 n=1 Tax=Montipora capricornis TaxID=246305 RepID=UPI0035F13AC1
MSKGKEAGKIQVYVRVRPFTEKEKEKRETNAIEIHQEHSLIRVLDPRSRTNYFFDGVFSPEATNQELYLKVGKPLVYAALNGYKGTLLTYGQTGTGKTFTLLSDDGITTRVVQHCFEKIDSDEIHTYKVMCSFLQVYQEKVYDLLNPRFIVDLPVREHPKKGVYVANLTQHEVKSAGDVFALLEIGKQNLVIAETKMVRHSSRSHSIMQLIVERRLKAHIVNEKPQSQSETPVSHEAVQESIMAVDETINNLIKELKQERKSHHKHERECLKELMEKELNNGNNFEGDLIVKGKINLCDLAGSERLTKTKAEGVRLTEAKYLNTSLLELGNVIYALARGHKRHVPYRNSTLTRLLQDCLGDNGKTNFIICIAPSLSEVNETKCSLNFGLRAMRITNVARLNVEVDYKVLAERLAKKLEDHDIKYKFEKLEYLREIQRLKSAISCYQESENFAGKDHEKLVSVIANLSKSVQREKEEKNNLQTELVCLKKQVSQPVGSNTPDVEAVLLAELMSMELLANLQTPDVTKSILSDTSLPAKVKSHLALADTQEALLNNAGCFLQLLDLHLDPEQNTSERKRVASDAKDFVHFNFSRAGSVELFSKDCSIKISPRGAPPEPCLSFPMYNTSNDESAGLAGGVRRMLGRLIGRDTKDKTLRSPENHSNIRPSASFQPSASGMDEKARDQEEAMRKTKALLRELSNSKEKVEQQVLSLMSSLFEEQIDRNEGQSPQWNELGKKLTRLIMFRRNNMPGLSDIDLWANAEDLNSVLENCLRFVIIDKALLACLLVIELLDLRQACEKLGDKKRMKGVAQENLCSSSKTQDEKLGLKGNIKPIVLTADKKTMDIGKTSTQGSVSPRREKLTTLKHTKNELEKEINDAHEDTTKLETELFSTMEEKTKVEEELFGVKHYVTKLRSELFHLKLEKSNLEKDVQKSKSQENLQQLSDSDLAKLNVESPKEGLRGYPELSDVMEASHESNDSENSSQMSDGNENREAFLKTCMESISKIYTFMPNPGEIACEDELSDDQEPTLSDANIDDSDEEIIITKLARSLRSPSASPSKEKSFEVSSPNKSGKRDVVSNSSFLVGNDTGSDDLSSKSKEALIKQMQELKRKLQKVEQELGEAIETNEDLEEELDHKKGQLAEAQQTITNLENQVVEEQETCEQVRLQYFHVKNQNEVLEEKIKALRSELERVLVRENNTLTGSQQSTEDERKRIPPPSPTKSSGKSLTKSHGKTKITKIDLKNPPPKQLSSNEMEVVGLIEENAEFKVKLEKASQDKARLEKSVKLLDDKSTKMKASLQASEDACNRLKNELSSLKKEKVKLTGEVTELRHIHSDVTEDLQRYREKSTRLEKDIEAIAYMSTRLEKDNKTLETEISKMELELSSWKNKHQESSVELASVKQERIHVEKACENALLELESLRKQREELLDERSSNEKETKRTNDELEFQEERFFELESEVSEQKRLNSNLQKEIAGMSEYQEALEKEYSKVKIEEERLNQELAQVRSRATGSETELSSVTHKVKDEVSSLDRELSFTRNPQKLELSRTEKTLKVTPSKKFYTITHTSEDEIGDTSSSIAESPADESKQLEHENQLLKLENGYLQQQLAESEQVLAMYRQDLESAHDLIDKLQANVQVEDNDAKSKIVEEDSKTPSDKDDTIKEIGECAESASDEYKLLEEKHAELTKEYEILRAQYQDALIEKTNEAKETGEDNKNLNQIPIDEDKATEVSYFNNHVSRLQERIKELEVENSHLKKKQEEYLGNEKAKKDLLKKLEDEKRGKQTLQEKIKTLESENETIKMKLEVTALQKGRKTRRLSLEDQLTSLKGEQEPVNTQTSQCSSRVQSSSLNVQKGSNKDDLRKPSEENGDKEERMQKLEQDLLKVASEKLKLEFQLRSVQTECERLRRDLQQSESERNLLNTQLDDNIEKAANLEIRLMEMRCSCETIKDEISTLKNEKRQESFHLHEASVCKEILEKRLEDALKENNMLRHELDLQKDEQKENEKKNAKLEKDKYQLTKEIEVVKGHILQLEQDLEGNKVRPVASTNAGNETSPEEYFRLEKLLESKDEKDGEKEELMFLREYLEKITADYNQVKNELEEVKSVKKSLEEQMEGGGKAVTKRETSNNCKNGNGRTTFDPLEIQKHTKLLEKEKGLLEKELTRVQEECNNLKEEIDVIRSASKNAQSQEDRRMELERKQEQLERELQELRELNQKLESECDDSHKLINQLEIKTKALESLQKELRCFHEENDRLTHEVDIIHHTNKAITDHQHDKESLEKENASLKQKLEVLKDSNRKLEVQNDDLSKEIVTLKEKSTGKMNVSLQNELEKYHKMQQHLEDELAACREKKRELENTNEALKKENKAVKGRIKSLEQRNEELKRREEKKKESHVENNSKAKSKAAQGITRESKEVQTEKKRILEGKDHSLQEKLEQLETEKVQLTNQLASLREKIAGQCAVVQEALGVNMTKETTEFSAEDDTPIKMGNGSLDNQGQEKEKELASFTEDVKAGFSMMAKENLLLERKASYFARSQMRLEQSFAKAMREKAVLKFKLVEAENVIAVLVEKQQHELEKNDVFLLPVTQLKQNELVCSHSDSCSVKHAQIKDRKDTLSDNNITSISKDAKGKARTSNSDDSYQSNSTRSRGEQNQTEIEQQHKNPPDETSQLEGRGSIHSDNSALPTVNTPIGENSCLSLQTQVLAEVEGFKYYEEYLKSESDLKTENIESSLEKEMANYHLTIGKGDGYHQGKSQFEVDQPRREEEQLIKVMGVLESQNNEIEKEKAQTRENLVGQDNKTESEDKHSTTNDALHPTQSVADQLQIETNKGLKDVEAHSSEKEDLRSEMKWTNGNVGNKIEGQGHEENTLLKQERKTLLNELEALKNENDWIESELRHSQESCIKQKQEIKLLLSSYTQEKESLLKELEDTKSDCRQAKEKVRDLLQIETDFEDIQKRNKEAEKLVTELEKDLLSQTEIKNELKRELQTCNIKLQEAEQLQTQLRTCRTENEDLVSTNMHLLQEIKKWKDDNELKMKKMQSTKMETHKRGFLSVDPILKRLQDQSVQTESVSDRNADRTIESFQDTTPPKADEDLGTGDSDYYAQLLVQCSESYENNEHQEDYKVEPECVQMAEFKKASSVTTAIAIPVIIVSYVDDKEKMTKKRTTSMLSLPDIKDFENETPNDQSTPGEEIETAKPNSNDENNRERVKERSHNVLESYEVRDKMLLGMDQHKVGENYESESRDYNKESGILIRQRSGDASSILQAEKDTSAVNKKNNREEALKVESVEMGHTKQLGDTEIIYHDTKEDVSQSRRELEWTISMLRSEVQQRSKDNEKSQHEISLLVEEQLSMKREISSLLNECESLKVKAGILQTQNEAILKEQVLIDEEKEELQQNLHDLTQEKNSIEEAKRNLENQKARLEIELSDAIETREAMEKELLCMRSEGYDVSKQKLEEQLYDISERYTKLETVLSCVLDENSKMTAEMSALQAENSMLKSFKIMEITDNCTQISPNNTEDESDTKMTTSLHRLKTNENSKPVPRLKSTLEELTDRPLPRSPGSSEALGNVEGPVNQMQSRDDEGIAVDETSITPFFSNTNSASLHIESVDKRFDERKKPDNCTQITQFPPTESETPKPYHMTRKGDDPSMSTTTFARKQQKKDRRYTSKDTSNFGQHNVLEDGLPRNLDDVDSSMEVHTDSSLVSATDLDISISSQISSEDSSVVGSEIRVLQRMQKELAETKCTNVLISNELSIIRKHNSDLQNQVQKLLSRNNHLKTKMCDRTLSVKRMEKEMSSIKEENNRLQQQALILHEEMARVEKEKAKFERNMSSTKSENKRLKSDLSSVKAEGYRTMKELVNLQSENRRLQLEIEKFREDGRSFKSGYSDESVSQEMSLWEPASNRDLRSVSHRSLQEKTAKPDPVYLPQRAASDQNFSQHQRLSESPETPELSPLNLSKELHDQPTQGGNFNKTPTTSTDTTGAHSASGSRSSDPMSRQSSPVSFGSDSSLPNETDENGLKCQKEEKQLLQEEEEEEGRGKNRNKIQTILRKLQHSKKNKSSK